jgi:hypothetical protein
MFAREIAEGRLVAPYMEEYEDGYGYYLTMAAEDLEDPVISVFRNWIITRFARRRTHNGLAAPCSKVNRR